MGQQKEPSVVLINESNGVYSVCEKLWVVLQMRISDNILKNLHQWAQGINFMSMLGRDHMGMCVGLPIWKLLKQWLSRESQTFSLPPTLAKRVLREVCIMRRIRHPYIISLSNAFTSRNQAIQGGIDLYIATEFADGGDMYHLKKPLEQDQVRVIIWQLLSGLCYLHSCHIWHRDIKPENVLFSSMMDVKICDFGLSRSTMESFTEVQPGSGPTTGGGRRHRSNKKPLLIRQFTKTVVTPIYRAPEVIMSQGQYTSAIDIWSLGCIFWELLAAQVCYSSMGSQRRLFAMREEPNTPVEREVYAEVGNSKLSKQLDLIFDVIGTPCWKDIESIPSKQWRSYLKQVPGRAGNLIANFRGVLEEEAMDLLSRMLAFDPARRCTAEEALKHAYFKSLQHPKDLSPVSFHDALLALPKDHVGLVNDLAIDLGLLERELENSMSQPDGGRHTLEYLIQREVEMQQEHFKIRKTFMVSIMAKAASDVMAKTPSLQFFPPLAPYSLPTVANPQQHMVCQSTQSTEWMNDLWLVCMEQLAAQVHYN